MVQVKYSCFFCILHPTVCPASLITDIWQQMMSQDCWSVVLFCHASVTSLDMILSFPFLGISTKNETPHCLVCKFPPLSSKSVWNMASATGTQPSLLMMTSSCPECWINHLSKQVALWAKLLVFFLTSRLSMLHPTSGRTTSVIISNLRTSASPSSTGSLPLNHALWHQVTRSRY